MFAQHDVDAYEDEKEGVIRTEDVRRAMKCVPAKAHTVYCTTKAKSLTLVTELKALHRVIPRN